MTHLLSLIRELLNILSQISSLKLSLQFSNYLLLKLVVNLHKN